MATAIQNKPIETLRERGSLKCTIWKNSSTKGSYFSAEFSRTYRTEQGYADSRSFNAGDLLVIARLATKAHDRIGELRVKDAAEKRASQ
jgi:hypothetical protein